MSSNLLSLIRERQSENFIGREQYINLFLENISLPPNDARRKFIFNIYGQGGVGKTTLLNYYKHLASSHKFVYLFTDESEGDLLSVLKRFSEQLLNQKIELPRFNTLVKKYGQRVREFERISNDYGKSFESSIGKSFISLDSPNTVAKILPPIQLHNLIVNHFNLSELKDLCFQIKIEFENLSGSTKMDKARELVLHCERRGKMHVLIETVSQLRPDIAWHVAIQKEPIEYYELPQNLEWESIIYETLEDANDIELMKKPTENLTASFFEDLHRLQLEHPLIFICDTYEITSNFLDVWWLNLLSGKFTENIPADLFIIISGRRSLNADRWSPLESVIQRIHLREFSLVSARQYLEKKGVSSPSLTELILKISGRLPLLLAVLTVVKPETIEDLDETSKVAVERFLKWIPDAKNRQLIIDCSLPRILNLEIVAVLVKDGLDDFFDWFQWLPFIKNRTDGWIKYHDEVRNQMIRYIQNHMTIDYWIERHTELADYFENQSLEFHSNDDVVYINGIRRQLTVEAFYHKLNSKYTDKVEWALKKFLSSLFFDWKFAKILAKTWEIAEDDFNSFGKSQSSLGKQLHAAMIDFENGNYEKVISVLERLKVIVPNDSYIASLIMTFIGRNLRKLGRFDESLQYLNQAIHLDNNVFAIYQRGWLYIRQGKLDKALRDFSQVLNEIPQSTTVLLIRGWIYQRLSQHEKALDDFQRIKSSAKKMPQLAYFRGVSCFFLQRFQEAIADFNYLVGFSIYSFGVYIYRGESLRQLNRQAEALEDFKTALNLLDEQNSKFNKIDFGMIVKRVVEQLRHDKEIPDWSRTGDIHREVATKNNQSDVFEDMPDWLATLSKDFFPNEPFDIPIPTESAWYHGLLEDKDDLSDDLIDFPPEGVPDWLIESVSEDRSHGQMSEAQGESSSDLLEDKNDLNDHLVDAPPENVPDWLIESVSEDQSHSQTSEAEGELSSDLLEDKNDMNDDLVDAPPETVEGTPDWLIELISEDQIHSQTSETATGSLSFDRDKIPSVKKTSEENKNSESQCLTKKQVKIIHARVKLLEAHQNKVYAKLRTTFKVSSYKKIRKSHFEKVLTILDNLE